MANNDGGDCHPARLATAVAKRYWSEWHLESVAKKTHVRATDGETGGHFDVKAFVEGVFSKEKR